MRSRLFIAFLILVTAITLLPAPSNSQAQESCEQVFRQSMSELGTNCAGLGPNSACVGAQDVTANFFPGQPAPEDFPARPADLTNLQALSTYGLDTAAGTWGVAVMNIQADLPPALNASAMMLAVGDVDIENNVAPEEALVFGAPLTVTLATATDLREEPAPDALVIGTGAAGTTLGASGISPDGEWVWVAFQQRGAWVQVAALEAVDVSGLPVITKETYTPMQSITVSTGYDNFGCGSTLPSMLIIQSPAQTPITLVINGVPTVIDGVLFIRQTGQNVFEYMTALGDVTFNPGAPEQVSVPAGAGITQADGAWQEALIYSQGQWNAYTEIEIIPPNVWQIEYTVPIIVEASGIGRVERRVRTIYGEELVTLRPVLEFIPGEMGVVGDVGEGLEREPVEAIALGGPGCPAWPVYHSNASGIPEGSALWLDLFRLDTVTGRSLLDNNISRGDGSRNFQPTFAPDGEWLAFTSNRHQGLREGYGIYVTRADGSLPVYRLTYNSANDITPVWSPDGQFIYFVTNRDGNWEIYRFSVENPALPERVTDDPANDINVDVFPNGEEIVIQSDRDGEWEIYIMNVATGELTQLTDNDTEDIMPIVSHDGTMIAWRQLDEFGVYNLWVMDLATLEARQLTDTGADVLGHVFAPDDTFLAYYSNYDGDHDVFAVRVEDGLIKAVTEDAAGEAVQDMAPHFYCDSPIILYQREEEGVEQAMQFEITEVNPLPLEGPANAPNRLTVEEQAEDVFPLGDLKDELNSNMGRAPEHP